MDRRVSLQKSLYSLQTQGTKIVEAFKKRRFKFGLNVGREGMVQIINQTMVGYQFLTDLTRHKIHKNPHYNEL